MPTVTNQSDAFALLQGIEFDDTRLYDLLRILLTNFYALNNQINPPTSTVFSPSGYQIPSIDNVADFTYFIDPAGNLRLTWTRQEALVNYQIKYNVGTSTDWNIATSILVTSSNVANIDAHSIPLTTGTYTFLIKAIDNSGNASATAANIVVIIPTIGTPVISATVISNNVLLKWTTPASTWNIAHYNVYRDGVLQGTVSGTFEAIFETTGGTYSYTVIAVDILGDVSNPSTASTVLVGNPSDFILLSTITSTFTGTKTNCIVELGRLLACVDTAVTYGGKYTTHGWATPNAKIAAGYPIYIEPSLTTGQYVEVFDIGSIISNVVITINWNSLVVAGTVSTSTSTLEFSTDNITYSSPVVALSTFAASVRYVRFTMKFVGSNDKSLTYFYNLQCILNVHREVDSGSVTCLAADVGGTVVTFNKAFKSVDAINVTAIATVEKTAIYDFAFPPNPTTFKILVYDAAGARVNASVTWIARGVI